MRKSVLSFLVFLISVYAVFAQDELKKGSIDLGSDFTSRYVWRGTDFGRSPSIQPYLSLKYKNIELGAWGAFTTNGPDIQETDLYLSYSPIDELTITLTDYFFPNDALTQNNYFEYGSSATTHLFELSASFNGTDNLPLSFLVATVFYGADKINNYKLSDPLNTDQNFSSYIELGYNFSIGENSCNTFLGVTTHDGLYGYGFNVVNIGITGYKDIKLTDNFTLPISSSLIVNPQSQNIFLVFGLSL